jgi:hypothetical protein
MVLEKFCMSDLQSLIAEEFEDKKEPMLELVYGSIARLSSLATGFEIKAHHS